jgi:hypothetical protein
MPVRGHPAVRNTPRGLEITSPSRRRQTVRIDL